jgi:hypothetical protein
MKMDKMALKRLTASDLTFFKWHFENQKAGNQKALNLSRNVFIDKLYPSLIEYLEERGTAKIPVTLYMYGPGTISEPVVLQRKILKSGSYKNWRLNGEFVYPPEDNPERFNILKPDDIILMGFEGITCPTALHIDYLSNNIDDDQTLNRLLSEFIGTPRGNMKEISHDELKDIVKIANPNVGHPIFRYILGEDIIETAMGDSEARLRVFRNSGRVMSAEELKVAQQKADEIGKRGEELIDLYLQNKKNGGEILDYEWSSNNNAVAPYDFKVKNNDGQEILVDVKTTLNSFTAPLHISMAEIRTMSLAPEEYVIYRVFELNDEGGKLIISSHMREYADRLILLFNDVPVGTKVDSVSCLPETLNFNNEIKLFYDYEE